MRSRELRPRTGRIYRGVSTHRVRYDHSSCLEHVCDALEKVLSVTLQTLAAPPSPAFIGTSNFRGTIETDFVAEQISSRELAFSGVSVVAHNVLGIKGHSLNSIHGLQLHFSWNTGYVSAAAKAGRQTLSYDNRPRYLYIISSPVEVEFELRPSKFKELAVQFEPSYLLKCCEAAAPAALEMKDAWDYRDPVCWEIAGVLFEECFSGAPNGLLYSESMLTFLALHVVRKLGVYQRLPRFSGRGGLAPTVLRRCCDYMLEHLADDVSLADLGALAGLSPGHLAAAFKQSMGMPPYAWLRQRRIARAMELLRDPRLDMSTIATCVGYENLSAFGAAFKKVTGRAPAGWRRAL